MSEVSFLSVVIFICTLIIGCILTLLWLAVEKIYVLFDDYLSEEDEE